MAIIRIPIELAWNGPGSPGVNVFHGRTAGVTQTLEEGVQELVDAVHAFYVTLAQDVGLGLGIYPTGLTASIGQVTDAQTDEAYSPTFSPVSGDGSGGESPEVLQWVVGWQSSVAARRGMGRTFVGPLDELCLQPSGEPNAGFITVLQSAADALVSASMGLTESALGVWGLETSGTGPDGAKVLRDFIGANVRPKFAVLRSRRD